MLAIKLDLSDDSVNSGAVECLGRDLLVTRLLCRESSMFRADPINALKCFEEPKFYRNRVFLQPR